MKRLLAILIATGAITVYPAPASAATHTLIVDGVPYGHTHEAGASIHWETPGSNPAAAAFAERNQTWASGDNGSEHLPCEFGVHWISNENVLTVSHCLDDPNGTTTTTEAQTSTTSTTVPDTTTTLSITTQTTTPPSTSGAATTTTALEATTSTLSPTTSTTAGPSTTAGASSTQSLPKTGDGAAGLIPYALLLILGGVLVVVASRRPETPTT